jgi:hypothetical protein
MDKEIRVPKEEFVQLQFSLLHCFFLISLIEQIFAYIGFKISFHLDMNLVCSLWPPVNISTYFDHTVSVVGGNFSNPNAVKFLIVTHLHYGIQINTTLCIVHTQVTSQCFIFPPTL